jgi:ADP-heptose:LPS heptosyltransferase
MIPMRRLQRADRVLGAIAFALAAPLVPLARLRRVREIRRVLLVKFWGLGSLQLMTPAVRGLRRVHPGARLVLLTLEGNAEFARRLGVFDEVIALDVAQVGWPGLFTRIASAIVGLRARRFDAVLDFEFFARFSAVVSFLSGAPLTLGFASDGNRRGGLHRRLVDFDRSWHVARNFRALAGADIEREVELGEFTPFPTGDRDRAEALAALISRGVVGAAPLVVLNPNAGALALERRWPVERFAELARRLALEDGAAVAVIGSAEERERAGEVALRAGSRARVANLAGELSIGALAALLEDADAFVSNDSGPMHLAAALGTPTLGLFGPESPAGYAPRGVRARALYRPPACSPCINVHDDKLLVCVRGRAECMTNIGLEEVLAAVRVELAPASLRRRRARTRLA